MILTISANYLAQLENGIASLLHGAFATNNTLYILGSGVSFRYSKMQSALAFMIAEDYRDGGCYDLDDKPKDSLAMTLIWPHIRDSDDELLKALTKKIPDSFIKVRINEEYSRQAYPYDNPEYKIFLSVRKGSTIIDMNYEGFSAAYLSQHHYVITLHEKANPYIAAHTKKIREEILAFDLDFTTSLPIKCYPSEKQSHSILAPYENHLFSIFPALQYLVIIGYTFASAGGTINDFKLFELVKERIAHYKNIQIIIIDPKPEPIAALFEKELHRTQIMPIYWNYLTRAIRESRLIPQRDYLKFILQKYLNFIISNN